MNEFVTAACTAARRAGAALRENLSGARQISYKGDVNLVTEMDRRSEAIVVETLLSSFPNHGILAEEETSIRNDSDFLWIIDPIDGTTNYAHGYPCFSVSIALQKGQEIIAAAVYDPMRDELFHAHKGGGAFLNTTPLRVSSTDTLIRSLLATGFPYDRKESKVNNMGNFHALLMASQEVRRDGSASLDLCSVACGRFDGFWELKLKPWDVAAGWLIVTEAGGRVTGFSGEPFDMHSGEILATNGRIHNLMIDILHAVTRNEP